MSNPAKAESSDKAVRQDESHCRETWYGVVEKIMAGQIRYPIS